MITSKKYKLNDKTLDKYQSKAVFCNKDIYLVVAGAGSGKTLTIVSKVKYLIENNVKSKNILCISFTNEAVNSLKKSLNNYGLDVDVKTFHKLSLDLIKYKYQISSNNLLEYITDEYFYSCIYNDNTYKLLEYISNIEYVKKLIISFIHQMKTLNYNHYFLINLFNNKKINSDEKIVLIFILKIYILYQEELASVCKIDFDDIINLAIEEVDSLTYFKYNYIIIDEYQDTSFSKYLLISKLVNKFSLHLMAVGDDFQSIYSFTGCNLKLFTDFKKFFPHSKIIKLKYTYRNPSDIVEVSKRFIMKNKNQINKRLVSNKYIKNSIVVVYIDNLENNFIKIVNNVDDILILGRNNKDIDPLINSGILNVEDNALIYREDKKKNLRFLTVHSSKGLEEKNIIILNVIDDTLGFPNKIKVNDILSYISSYDQMEEERRLFYVALTRASNRVFIFTIKNKESIFVKELIKEFKYKIKIVDFSKKTFNN